MNESVNVIGYVVMGATGIVACIVIGIMGWLAFHERRGDQS